MRPRPTQLQMKRRIAASAVIAIGLLGVGLPTAGAHTATLGVSGRCQDDGTRQVTYSGDTHNVPGSGQGHVATLTVDQIKPPGSLVSPVPQTVTGNTTFTFTQTISGHARQASATANLVWGDGAKSHPTGEVNFQTNCPIVVPPEPDPVVVVTSSDVTNCDAGTVTTTTVTATTGWVLVGNVWVKGTPVVAQKVTTRATSTQECPIVVPPPPVPTETTTTTIPQDPPLIVESVGAAVALTGAEANPLPAGASAGQVDTGGQLVAGGLAAFAGFLMLVAGFVLRRRHGEA